MIWETEPQSKHIDEIVKALRSGSTFWRPTLTEGEAISWRQRSSEPTKILNNVRSNVWFHEITKRAVLKPGSAP
jgi:hypothetical protein